MRNTSVRALWRYKWQISSEKKVDFSLETAGYVHVDMWIAGQYERDLQHQPWLTTKRSQSGRQSLCSYSYNYLCRRKLRQRKRVWEAVNVDI